MDSKTIKVEAELYDKLDQYRLKGETFSDALRKVVNAAELVRAASAALGRIPIYDISEPHPWDKPEEVKTG